MQLLSGCALLLPLWCRAALGASLRSSSVASFDRAASFSSVEAEDRRFWAGEWNTIESELVRLFTISGKNFTANASAKGAANTSAKASITNHSKPHHKNPLAGIKLNLNPKSVTDLLPALAMLKSLYEEGKQNIANLNEREKKSKQFIEEKEAQHKKKLAQIEEKFKKGLLSEEFRVNETRDETRSWTYWTHVRERQHRQFHTSLKIQHATMMKEKNMIDMYEKTIAGTADKKEVVQELGEVSGGAAIEVVFLQQASSELADYCVSTLADVRRQQAELQEGLPLGASSEKSMIY